MLPQKTFLLATGVIFTSIALLHALRIVFGWKVVIGAWIVPMWVSWVALIVAAYLSYASFNSGRRYYS